MSIKNIALSSLMPIEDIRKYKIHFAVGNGDDQPLDVFVRSRDAWLGWNRWHSGRDDFSRQYIFSLMRYYHQPNRWLFGGIFEVIARQKKSYEVKLIDRFQEYIGRLLVSYPGPGTRGRAFLFEKHYEQLEVDQLFSKPFEGEDFCGYENVEHSFRQLEAVIKSNKTDWKAALENVKGVYLIVDKSNGKKYVGSAYGESGIWSRWACYIGTGHGWNDELTKLISEKGIGHAREHFQFAILEFRSMKTDDKVIIDREQYWKRVMLSNAFGYNKN